MVLQYQPIVSRFWGVPLQISETTVTSFVSRNRPRTSTDVLRTCAVHEPASPPWSDRQTASIP